MKSNEYFQRMYETSKEINPLIEAALEPLKKVSCYLYHTVSELPKKRIETGSKVRAYLLRHAYEITTNKDWKRISPICAAVEMELCSMYYTNRIYDKKGNERDINKQIMAAKITRDLASSMLEQSREHIGSKLEKILYLINESDLICESGQYLDVCENTYETRKHTSFEEMINFCNNRIYKINASYLEKIAKMGAILGGADNKIIESLESFGKEYGMLLQIVNDIMDFVPKKDNGGTSEKIPEDAYSDIKHGKLTYPVIYTLHHGTNEQKRKVINVIEKGPSAKDDSLEEITKIFVNNGSINFAKKQARKNATQAKKTLRSFDKKQRRHLSRMCIITYKNRFYDSLRKYNILAKP